MGDIIFGSLIAVIIVYLLAKRTGVDQTNRWCDYGVNVLGVVGYVIAAIIAVHPPKPGADSQHALYVVILLGVAIAVALSIKLVAAPRAEDVARDKFVRQHLDEFENRFGRSIDRFTPPPSELLALVQSATAFIERTYVLLANHHWRTSVRQEAEPKRPLRRALGSMPLNMVDRHASREAIYNDESQIAAARFRKKFKPQAILMAKALKDAGATSEDIDAALALDHPRSVTEVEDIAQALHTMLEQLITRGTKAD